MWLTTIRGALAGPEQRAVREETFIMHSVTHISLTGNEPILSARTHHEDMTLDWTSANLLSMRSSTPRTPSRQHPKDFAAYKDALRTECKRRYVEYEGHPWSSEDETKWKSALSLAASEDAFDRQALHALEHLAAGVSEIEALCEAYNAAYPRPMPLRQIAKAHATEEVDGDTHVYVPSVSRTGWFMTLCTVAKTPAFGNLGACLDTIELPKMQPASNDDPALRPTTRGLAWLARRDGLSDRQAAIVSILLGDVPRIPEGGFDVGRAITCQTESIRSARNRIQSEVRTTAELDAPPKKPRNPSKNRIVCKTTFRRTTTSRS